jgi:hypothetical protein
MKNLKKVLAASIVFVAFTTASKAQSSGTATSTATIVTPIAITKTADMNFGNIAVTATGGTVVLPAATSSPVRTTTGGVTLPATTGTVTSAAFSVTGSNSYTYAITLPSTAVTLTSGSNTMSAATFTSSVGATSALSSSGSDAFAVGATLTVAANQAAGTYLSGNFTVTVNYN